MTSAHVTCTIRLMWMLAISEVTWVGGSLGHWSDSSSDGGVDDLRF